MKPQRVRRRSFRPSVPFPSFLRIMLPDGSPMLAARVETRPDGTQVIHGLVMRPVR